MPRQGPKVGRAQLDCWLHQANNRAKWFLSPAPFLAKQELCPQGPSAEVVWPLMVIKSKPTGLSHLLLLVLAASSEAKT